MIVVAPIAYLRHAGSSYTASSGSPVAEAGWMAWIENYASQRACTRPVLSVPVPEEQLATKLAEGPRVADLHLEKPFLNLVNESDNDQPFNHYQPPHHDQEMTESQEEQVFPDYCNSFSRSTCFDVEAFLEDGFTDDENTDCLSSCAWTKSRQPVLAEKPAATNPSVSAYPAEITPGRYRIVDNLGFVTETVLTDNDVDLFAASEKKPADHYVLRQGPRTIFFVRLMPPVTARRIQYFQMYHEWIGKMSSGNVQPLAQTLSRYMAPGLGMTEDSLQQMTTFTRKMWQEVIRPATLPARLSDSPQNEGWR